SFVVSTPLPLARRSSLLRKEDEKRRKQPMRATVFHDPLEVQIEQVRDVALQEPTGAVVGITHACICGSDVWPYRGREVAFVVSLDRRRTRVRKVRRPCRRYLQP